MAVVIKLFIGTAINSELRMYLNASKSWKKEQTLHDTALTELRHNQKDYIGRHLSESQMDLSTLQHEHQQLRDQILGYCPDVSRDSLKFVVLAQQFLT